MAATWLASHFNVIEPILGTDVPEKEDSMSDWVKHYYAVVDSMDVEKFAPLHTEDVRLRFGNAETVVGRDAVVRGITDFWGAIKGLRHNFVQTWDEGDVEIVEALIDYTRHDGKVVTLPCTSILRKRGDLVQDLRIYMDVSPVFA
jgi:ketosteroid isomerase-like protein